MKPEYSSGFLTNIIWCVYNFTRMKLSDVDEDNSDEILLLEDEEISRLMTIMGKIVTSDTY